MSFCNPRPKCKNGSFETIPRMREAQDLNELKQAHLRRKLSYFSPDNIKGLAGINHTKIAPRRGEQNLILQAGT